MRKQRLRKMMAKVSGLELKFRSSGTELDIFLPELDISPPKRAQNTLRVNFLQMFLSFLTLKCWRKILFNAGL